MLALADEGVAHVDARAGGAGRARTGRNIVERVTLLIDGLREDDREAGSDIIFVVIFQENIIISKVTAIQTP